MQNHGNFHHLLYFINPLKNGKIGMKSIALVVSLFLEASLPKVATTAHEVEEVVPSTLASSVARVLIPIIFFCLCLNV